MITSWVMKEKFDLGRCGGNQSDYLGLGIKKVIDSDSDGIILPSDNYEGKLTI